MSEENVQAEKVIALLLRDAGDRLNEEVRNNFISDKKTCININKFFWKLFVCVIRLYDVLSAAFKTYFHIPPYLAGAECVHVRVVIDQ